MTKPMWPSGPIVNLRAFYVVLPSPMIVWIFLDHAMCFCSGRLRVSVQKLKFHPRIIFVSANPPSAFNLSYNTIGSRGIGSLMLFGQAGCFKSVGIACPGEIDGESSWVNDVDICIAAGINWDVDDQVPSPCKRYVVV